MNKEYMKLIAQNKKFLGGKPRIKNTRMSIDIIASYLSNGYGIKEIKDDYPYLTNKQIQSAIDFLDIIIHKERAKLEPKIS